jgi:hypothetical protein
LYSALPRPTPAAPVNRARRRAQHAQFRAHARAQFRRDGGGDTLVLNNLRDLFDRDASGACIDTPTETIIDRAIACVEKQVGGPLPPAARENFAATLRAQMMNIERTSAGHAPVAGVINTTGEQEEDGRRLRDELLPVARAIAASLRRSGRASECLPKHNAVADHLVPPGAASKPDRSLDEALRANGFTAADIAGVLVYEAPTGWPSGWHGDVVLHRDMTPFADVFGSRVAQPWRTREEAVKSATRTLASMLLVAAGEEA